MEITRRQIRLFMVTEFSLINIEIIWFRDHSFSMRAKFSENRFFLTRQKNFHITWQYLIKGYKGRKTSINRFPRTQPYFYKTLAS